MTEKFLLVTPRGFSGDVGDIAKLSKKLAFVRFSRETPVGLRIDQHLSRLRIEIPRAMEGDRSSVVMAPVAAGMGFAILTSTMLIDGLAEGMEIDVHALPFTGLSRNILLVARERELGSLPEAFAARTAEVLTNAHRHPPARASGRLLHHRPSVGAGLISSIICPDGRFCRCVAFAIRAQLQHIFCTGGGA